MARPFWKIRHAMQPARTYSFAAPVAGLLAVSLAWGGLVLQAPGLGGTGAALACTIVLALGAAQALHQCWISAAYWMVPVSQRPRGWSRTELVLMASTALLAAATMGAALHALLRLRPADLTEAAALCGTLSVALCALLYASARGALLVRKRLRNRQRRTWRAAPEAHIDMGGVAPR